jgi:gluconokinase
MTAAARREGVLALDLGTSSVRAVVYDATGRMLQPTYTDLPYRVDTAEPGQVSSDPQMLVRLIIRAIDGAIRAARKDHRRILAVGASCYWHSLMGVDATGGPTTELITWADTRSVDETVRLRETFDEHAYHGRTGCFFHASFWPAKLGWLRRTRPSAVRATACWVGLGEFLYERLLGHRVASLSMASGTGLLDVRHCRWDPAALRFSGISAEQLPPLLDWDQPLSGLSHSYARRWPELAAVPWYLPVGDGALANVGAACLRPEWFCATIGTSGALRVIVDHPRVEPPWGAFTYRLDRRRVVVGGALSEGGNVIRWFETGLGLKHRKRIESDAARLEPDGHQLTVLPFWAGERSPNWRSNARAVIAGLTLSTSAGDVMRAVMEAISYQFAAVYDAMRRIVPRPRAVIATGGRLVHTPVWDQILADTLAIPVMESTESEASSRGAALLALHALGRRPRLWQERPRRGELFRPRARLHQIYADARARQARLYALLLPAPGQPEGAATEAEKVESNRPSAGGRSRSRRRGLPGRRARR